MAAYRFPMTRSEFHSEAKPLRLVITDEKGAVVYDAEMLPKDFSTKSVGYGANGRITLPIGTKRPEFMVGVNLTGVNSSTIT